MYQIYHELQLDITAPSILHMYAVIGTDIHKQLPFHADLSICQ